MASDAIKTMKKVEKKTNKPAPGKAKKPNIFKRFVRYFKDVVAELKRVTWPTRKELMSATLAVVVFVVIMTIIVGGLDFGFLSLMKLISLFKGSAA